MLWYQLRTAFKIVWTSVDRILRRLGDSVLSDYTVGIDAFFADVNHSWCQLYVRLFIQWWKVYACEGMMADGQVLMANDSRVLLILTAGV